jgi:hypothetical protein
VSVYATVGWPLKVVLETDLPSAVESKTELFQPACEVTALLVAGAESPNEFFATTENSCLTKCSADPCQ